MSDQLSDDARATALVAARTMFPHDALPDDAYANVFAQLDDPQAFVELDEDGRLEALRRCEGSPFFDLLKATAVVAIYDNPLVWKAFGYEGPSVHLGGYLNRGFDDLDWLPDPPLELDPAAGSHHR